MSIPDQVDTFCSCGEAMTVIDKGDGVSRHTGCGKPLYISYLKDELGRVRAELTEMRSLNPLEVRLIEKQKEIEVLKLENERLRKSSGGFKPSKGYTREDGINIPEGWHDMGN